VILLGRKKTFHISKIIPHLDPKSTNKLIINIEDVKEPIVFNSNCSEKIYNHLSTYIKEEEDIFSKQIISDKDKEISTNMGNFLFIETN